MRELSELSYIREFSEFSEFSELRELRKTAPHHCGTDKSIKSTHKKKIERVQGRKIPPQKHIFHEKKCRAEEIFARISQKRFHLSLTFHYLCRKGERRSLQKARFRKVCDAHESPSAWSLPQTPSKFKPAGVSASQTKPERGARRAPFREQAYSQIKHILPL